MRVDVLKGGVHISKQDSQRLPAMSQCSAQREGQSCFTFYNKKSETVFFSNQAKAAKLQSSFRGSANGKPADERLGKLLSQLKLLV